MKALLTLWEILVPWEAMRMMDLRVLDSSR
jgi:hypothetical protein